MSLCSSNVLLATVALVVKAAHAMFMIIVQEIEQVLFVVNVKMVSQFLSLVKTDCTLDSLCGKDQWFWLIFILAAMAYAQWYTLKDDIFALFFGLLGRIKNHTKRPKSKKNDTPLKMKSLKKKRMSLISSHEIDHVYSVKTSNEDVTSDKGETNDHCDKTFSD